MKKTCLLFFSFLLFTVFSLTAQSAGKIDQILGAENLSKGQACYLLGTFSGKLSEDISFQAAFEHYKDLKMFKDDSAGDDVRLDEFADLILRNIELPKSFWYVITKSPYYALRHLKRMDLILAHKASSSSIKTADALNLLSKLSQLAEEEPEAKAESETDSSEGEENEEN